MFVSGTKISILNTVDAKDLDSSIYYTTLDNNTTKIEKELTKQKTMNRDFLIFSKKSSFSCRWEELKKEIIEKSRFHNFCLSLVKKELTKQKTMNRDFLIFSKKSSFSCRWEELKKEIIEKSRFHNFCLEV